jgi:hypothetical protein
LRRSSFWNGQFFDILLRQHLHGSAPSRLSLLAFGIWRQRVDICLVKQNVLDEYENRADAVSIAGMKADGGAVLGVFLFLGKAEQ